MPRCRAEPRHGGIVGVASQRRQDRIRPGRMAGRRPLDQDHVGLRQPAPYRMVFGTGAGAGSGVGDGVSIRCQPPVNNRAISPPTGSPTVWRQGAAVSVRSFSAVRLGSSPSAAAVAKARATAVAPVAGSSRTPPRARSGTRPARRSPAAVTSLASPTSNRFPHHRDDRHPKAGAQALHAGWSNRRLPDHRGARREWPRSAATRSVGRAGLARRSTASSRSRASSSASSASGTSETAKTARPASGASWSTRA